MASNLERLFSDAPNAPYLQLQANDKVGIRITDFNLHADKRYRRHYVREDPNGDASCPGLDFQHYFVLEMPNFQKNIEELRSPLDRWMAFLNRGGNWNPDDMPDSLKRFTDLAGAVEKLTTLWLNSREKEVYEGQLMFRMDWQARLWTAYQKGLEEGRRMAQGKSIETE